jgi:hypothetical protein
MDTGSKASTIGSFAVAPITTRDERSRHRLLG